ncbi:hypothetical protein ACFL2C_01545 [Patescibacteria group bacterium]
MMKSNQKGAVILLYVTIVSVIAFLLLLVSQSRLMLAIRRNQSSLDSLNTTNQAESEINDLLAKIVGGYLGESDFPINETFEIGDIEVTVEGEQVGDIQTLLVKTNKGYATSQIEAVREIKSIANADEIQIILALDCTGSMDKGADCADCDSSPTRFDALRQATINFIDAVADDENSDKFKVGIMVFGVDAKWMEHGVVEIRPGNTDFDTIKTAINNGIGSTRSESPACQSVMDATSVGSAYSQMSNYFSGIANPRIKKIAIGITDGLPNSTSKDDSCNTPFCPAYPRSTDGATNYCTDNDYGWNCTEFNYNNCVWDVDAGYYCDLAYTTCEPLGKEYLSCALADTDTFISDLGRNGTRGVDIDAYAVTIYANTPFEIASILRDYTVGGGYFNAPRATQLSDTLETIYRQIIKDRSIIKIKRVVS